jgi:hypothetical protein
MLENPGLVVGVPQHVLLPPVRGADDECAGPAAGCPVADLQPSDTVAQSSDRTPMRKDASARRDR